MLSRDTETIDLTTAKGQVQGLRIYAKRRGIEISNVEVTYSDGTVHNERRSINLLEGERTREIDPPQQRQVRRSGNRHLQAAAGRNRAIAVGSLWRPNRRHGPRSARRRPAAPAATQPQRQPRHQRQPLASCLPVQPQPAPTAANPGQATDTGEVLFGTQQVGFGVDRDVIRVGAEIGKFDKIALRVLDNDIFINSLKVVYANGESEEIAYNAEIKKNSRTRYLALKGDRFIKEIQLVYRSTRQFPWSGLR